MWQHALLRMRVADRAAACCARQVALGKRNASSSSEENQRSSLLSAREYVESLHQNHRTQLLYGKNNVIVQPVGGA